MKSAEMVVELRDGRTAVVSLGVALDASAAADPGREHDLSMLLGGFLAGSLSRDPIVFAKILDIGPRVARPAAKRKG